MGTHIPTWGGGGTRWAVGRIQGLCSASGSLMASAPLRLSEKHALKIFSLLKELSLQLGKVTDQRQSQAICVQCWIMEHWLRVWRCVGMHQAPEELEEALGGDVWPSGSWGTAVREGRASGRHQNQAYWEKGLGGQRVGSFGAFWHCRNGPSKRCAGEGALASWWDPGSGPSVNQWKCRRPRRSDL